jgi:Putative Na+/H+ antiporter
VSALSSVTSIEAVGALLFALAVVHTFSTRYFEHLAHTQPAHSGLWHLLGEVETVFGFWALLLLVFMALAQGWTAASEYLDSRHFVEPMFVFVIMVMAASRPIMQLASDTVAAVARTIPLPPGIATYFVSLSLVPLLGSLITEPAAMTLAALMLRDRIFSRGASSRLQYATLGVLFVNVSIGGTLTNFAAPPVLMVAAKWDWSTAHIFTTLGWKSAVAVLVNAFALTMLFRRELAERALAAAAPRHHGRVPAVFVGMNLGLLAAVVVSNRDPEVFMGLFLVFLGLAEAYKRHHDRLILREGLMVAFFLAGLVVIGGQQKWWLQEALLSLDESTLFFGAAALTAITDNAALTYLGSLVDGVSEDFKYALVAGAVAGGGLTVIANAPNPAGFAILKDSFKEGAINPFGLFVAALPPTLIAIVCLWAVRGPIEEVFDLQLWHQWFSQLDRSFLFLLILPFVVAAVGLWAEFARGRRHPESDDSSGPR